MADEQGAVIIRDAEGTEHEFPAGFDPKRAAGIVRARATAGDVGPKTPADLYAGPTNYDDGWWKSIKDQGKDVARAGLNALPGVGALVGGILSTPETFGAGTLPGAALGAGVGKGARDLIGHYTGLDAPSTPLEKAGGIAKEAAITGAVGAVLPGVITAARTPVQTTREASEQFASAMPTWARRLGRLIPSAPKGAPAPIMQRPAWQTWETPPGAPDLTRPVQAGSQTQAELTARAQAVREAGGLPAQEAVPPSTQPTVGQLRMAEGQGGQSAATLSQPLTETNSTPQIRGTLRSMAPTEPPMGAGRQTPPTNWKTDVPDKVGSALDPARVDIGAEATGRATGMTKQQVRDVATPILDAAPGEASPILPEAALKRMIDTLKALPKGGPEREAYVAKATSGKTQWQIENIRRTLEHLGLVVPAAVGGGALVRDEILKRLRSEQVQ